MRTPADNRLHIDCTVISKFQHCRESLSFLGGKAVQKDTAFLQKLGNLPVIHFPVTDDGIDVEHTRRMLTCVVFAAIALACLHHVAAAERTASYNLLF